MDLRIVGTILLSVCMICLTVMARDWMREYYKAKRRKERELKARADSRDQRFHDGHEALWMEEKAKRISAEQEVAALQKKIERMEQVMGTVQIGKMREYK